MEALLEVEERIQEAMNAIGTEATGAAIARS
ncbi:MAG: Unknown protein [uncultured Thiotrichaceae bacterium]|uniref:Uncharacterized protein n=1 Tax=uncultured Thiotrichaceae bacterium TaxID=298394 RepID=A0A6S6U433_9GAMM|nr:MAG: Unknown protein [uncultured Thiotrichaceae bacterium]